LYEVCFIVYAVNQLVIYGIDFFYINIFDLLIKIYLSLIFIKYFINKSKIKIKSLKQKYFTKKIIKLL
jgi:hypothetical protein